MKLSVWYQLQIFEKLCCANEKAANVSKDGSNGAVLKWPHRALHDYNTSPTTSSPSSCGLPVSHIACTQYHQFDFCAASVASNTLARLYVFHFINAEQRNSVGFLSMLALPECVGFILYSSEYYYQYLPLLLLYCYCT